MTNDERAFLDLQRRLKNSTINYSSLRQYLPGGIYYKAMEDRIEKAKLGATIVRIIKNSQKEKQ